MATTRPTFPFDIDDVVLLEGRRAWVIALQLDRVRAIQICVETTDASGRPQTVWATPAQLSPDPV